MKSCATLHGNGVKHVSGIKNKWLCKKIRSAELKLQQITIFIDFGTFLVNFGYFWHPYSVTTGPNELKTSQKLHQIIFHNILKNRNHSVTLIAWLYLQPGFFISFWPSFKDPLGSNFQKRQEKFMTVYS